MKDIDSYVSKREVKRNEVLSQQFDAKSGGENEIILQWTFAIDFSFFVTCM